MTDIKYRPIVIPKATVDKLLKLPKVVRGNVIALYVFYYYTAIWQKTNQPHCTTSYVAGNTENGLGWGKGKIYAAKKALKSVHLIKDIRQRPKGKGQGSAYRGSYIEVIYYHSEAAAELAIAKTRITELENELNEVKNQLSGFEDSSFPRGSAADTNAYSSNSANAYSSNSKRDVKKTSFSPILVNSSSIGDRTKIPPLAEWVTNYAKSIGYTLDADKFMDYYGSQGWRKANGQKLRDWQCAVRNWKYKSQPTNAKGEPVDENGETQADREAYNDHVSRMVYESGVTAGEIKIPYEEWLAFCEQSCPQ